MIWKKTNFEFYEVSDTGEVRSIDRMVNTKGGSKRLARGRILAKTLDKDGYYCVCIHDNGKQFPKFVHQLVAKAFIPNPENKPCIDHINTIKTDNRVDNLRWCTYSENNLNPITRKRKSEASSNRRDNKKGIIQYTTDGELVNEYCSTRQAERTVNIDCTSIIRCCKNKQKTAGGYIWKYKIR